MSKNITNFSALQEIRNWSSEDVATLLRKSGLAEYAEFFKTMAINGETLMGLNEVYLNKWSQKLGYDKNKRELSRLLEDIRNNPEKFVTHLTMKSRNSRQNYETTSLGLRKISGEETASNGSAFRPPISIPSETSRFDRPPVAVPNENNYRSRPPASIPEKPQLQSPSPALLPGKININRRAPAPAPEEPRNRSRSPAPAFGSQYRSLPPSSDAPQLPSRSLPTELQNSLPRPPVTEVPSFLHRPPAPDVPFYQIRSLAPEVQNFQSRPPAPEVPSLQARPPAPENQSFLHRPPAPEVPSFQPRPLTPEVQNFQSRPPAPEVQNFISRPPAPEVQDFPPAPNQEYSNYDDDDNCSWGSDFQDDDIGSDSDKNEEDACYLNYNNNNNEVEDNDQPEYINYDEENQNQHSETGNISEDLSLPAPPPRSKKPATPSLPNRPANLPLKTVSSFPQPEKSNFATNILPPTKLSFEEIETQQSQLPQPPGLQLQNLDVYFPSTLIKDPDIINDEEPDYETMDLDNPYRNNQQHSQPSDDFKRDQNAPIIPPLPSSMPPKRNQSQWWQVEQQNAVLDSLTPQISMPNKMDSGPTFGFQNQHMTHRNMSMPTSASRASENSSGYDETEEMYDIINENESFQSDEYYLTPTQGPEIASSINNQLPGYKKAPLDGHPPDLPEPSRPVLPLPTHQQQPRDGVLRNLISLGLRSHSKPALPDREISSPPEIGSGKKPAPPPSSSTPGGFHAPKPSFPASNLTSHDSNIVSNLIQRPLPPPPDEKVSSRQPILPSGPPPGTRHSAKASNARNGPQPQSSHTLQSAPWYHHLNRIRAEEALRALGEDGCFMVRPSSLTSNPLTLTLLFKGRLFNIPIRKRQDGLYALGSEKHNELVYPTVEALIHNYFIEKLALYSCGEKSGRTNLTVTPPKRT